MSEIESNKENLSTNIDLIQLVKVLWEKIFLISSITFFFAICSVVYSFSLPNIYESRSLISVVKGSGGDNLSSITSQYSGVASLAGLNLPKGYEDKTDLVKETIKSRGFLKRLILKEQVLINLMAVESYDSATKKINYDPEIYDSEKEVWVREESYTQNPKPSYLEAHEIYLDKLKVAENEFTGYLEISFEHLSPDFAHYFLNLVISEANSLIKEDELDRAYKSLDYLKEQLRITQLPEVKLSINQLIKSQLETVMLANINEDYILRPIDEPYIPFKKSRPSRAMICILGTLLGGFFSVLFVLVRSSRVI
mgnify:FL=1